MESLYKLKIEILSKIHKNKQAQKERIRLEKVLKQCKQNVSQSAKDGLREVKLSFGRENDAKMVEKYFTKRGFKAVSSYHSSAYLSYQVTISW